MFYLFIFVANPCAPTQDINSISYSGTGSITGVFGDVVFVDCDTGYVGGGDTLCQADGTWTNTTCLKLANVCNIPSIPGTLVAGQVVPVCIVVSYSTRAYKTVFYPSVDEFTLLEVDRSWTTRGLNWWGDGDETRRIHIEINGTASELLQARQGPITIPYWTITAQTENGVLSDAAPFVWDNQGEGCYGGCPESDCLDGFCGVDVSICGDDVGDTDCDLKIYLGWYGTDADGNYLTSASKRLSNFRSWSLEGVFASATSIYENLPNPQEIVDEVTDSFFDSIGF